jgi:hypothetical protein
MSTAARIARFSIVRRIRVWRVGVGHIPPGGTGGTAGAVSQPGSDPGRGRARPARAVRIPSTSAQNGSSGAATAILKPCSQPEPVEADERSSSRSHSPHASKCPPHLTDYRRHGRRRHGRSPDDHDGYSGGSFASSRPVGLAQPAPDSVPRHRPAHLTAHREPRALALVGFRLTPQHDHQRPIDSLALLEERLKLGAAGQPFTPGEPPCYTVRRLRPFARRRLRTLRPPLVAIRARNPWVFFRRRTFG